MFRLDKRKIFLLYQYYLLGYTTEVEKNEDTKDNEKQFSRKKWFISFIANENIINESIRKYLNNGWTLARLPELERAVLGFAVFEIVVSSRKSPYKIVMDQTINFCKTYLDKKKYRYVNKVLDFIVKEKNQKKDEVTNFPN